MNTQASITAIAIERYRFSQSVAVLLALLIALILPCVCPAVTETFDSPTAELDEDVAESVSSERSYRENRKQRRSKKSDPETTKRSNQTSSRRRMVTQFAGHHRLSNGLLAPLKC